MAALFTAASTQYLVNSAPPVLDFPFTVGMWVNLTAIGTVARCLFALSDTATTNNYLSIQMFANEGLGLAAAAGGTENTTASGISLAPAGAWCFALARFISSTNRRVAGLKSTGDFAAAAGTTARAPAGMDTATIGALSTSGGITLPWGGLIGEFWLANGDIYTDSAANVDQPFMTQLAYGGPFSVPHMQNDILEYHSFRRDLSSDTFDNEEDFLSIPGTEIFTNTNGVTVGWHPPLPYWYEKPRQYRRVLTI